MADARVRVQRLRLRVRGVAPARARELARRAGAGLLERLAAEVAGVPEGGRLALDTLAAAPVTVPRASGPGAVDAAVAEAAATAVRARLAAARD